MNDCGPATHEATTDAGGETKVVVRRHYPAGLEPPAAYLVWQIVSDFSGIKTIFPSLLSVYVIYPDTTSKTIEMIRHMTFAPPDPTQPVSPQNSLATGVEKLVEHEDRARRIAYTAVLGLPVIDYHSEMKVEGTDGALLTWTSTFKTLPGQEGMTDVIAGILKSGADQIATALESRSHLAR